MKQEPENGYMRKLRTLCRERRKRIKEPQKSEFFRERKRERRERQSV